MMFWSQLITIAITAELATPNDRVVAYEINENLAKRAEANLREYTNVDVILGDTTKAGNLPSLDAIMVFRCDPCSRKLAFDNLMA
jgi:protein-L-isoaspartate O-methyltransferase